MRHGLIPVTMRGTGMDELEAYCEYFEGYRISQIEGKICELVSMSPRFLSERSDQIYEYANRKFVLEEYTESLKKVLEAVMGVKKEH